MRHIVNPIQNRLFDPYAPVLSEKTRDLLLDSWIGVVRHVILQLMPVDTLAAHFDPKQGRPTKELYSMAGLLLIMEFRNWTKEEALNAYRYHLDIHYALNLEPVAHEISMRTLERYINYFEEDDLAKSIMGIITAELVELLSTKIDQQRLDSTHIFSDMASFGRTRMMGVAIKRFLTQVNRHHGDAYLALSESLRQRYAPGVHQLFGNTGKDDESRRLLRQQVAEDMYELVRHFAGIPACAAMTTYKLMEQVFYQQCEVQEETVAVKAKSGGDVIQNTSDPDATYDGHKGSGYQAQIAETCHPDNEVQLITCVIPQTAAESDTQAVPAVLVELKGAGLLPETLLADTLYTSDDNVQYAGQRGVELIGPAPSGPQDPHDDLTLTVDDFAIDETRETVICCPAGYAPDSSEHDVQTGKTHTVMPQSACSRCDFVAQCPVRKSRDGYRLTHTAKERRLAGRRCEEATEVFKERYRVRGGIEGTNSGLKRRTGLGQLRVRGRPRVFHAIYLKIAGWNILRAAVCAQIRKIVRERALAAFSGLFRHGLPVKKAQSSPPGCPATIFPASVWRFIDFSRVQAAA